MNFSLLAAKILLIISYPFHTRPLSTLWHILNLPLLSFSDPGLHNRIKIRLQVTTHYCGIMTTISWHFLQGYFQARGAFLCFWLPSVEEKSGTDNGFHYVKEYVCVFKVISKFSLGS